ncbi:MAG: alpha/beta hydrolase family protein [Planctomycetaceae bacterium]
MRRPILTGTALLVFAANVISVGRVAAAGKPPKLSVIRVKSSLDGSMQPSMFWAPESAETKSTPLFVYLHSWSGDYRQKNTKWFAEAAKRGWIILHPDFRGRNDHPEACGSKLARRDILDAVDYVIARYKVDASRIYLAGTSGGGHMAMLMAGHHPRRFSAVSAWVGISDLAEWYRFHTRNGKPGRYAKMIAASLGGPPGKSKSIAAAYKDRSPIFHLHRVGDLPIEICAGVKDGKTGSVPIHHSLRAFNAIAEAGKHPTVSQRVINELWKTGSLTRPKSSDAVKDAAYGRAVILRRRAGAARITLFDGGHEGLPKAAIHWLSRHTRATVRTP